MIKPEGMAIIGVPVEVGVPAIYKGIFRMIRRYGEFDANIKNVALSFFLRPPKNRPISEISPGFRYHYPHMGFDFRHLKEALRSYFTLYKVSASPFSTFGSWLMPEVNFVTKKAKMVLQHIR